MLTIPFLRKTLAAALGGAGQGPNAGGLIDSLAAHGLLPRDGEALTPSDLTWVVLGLLTDIERPDVAEIERLMRFQAMGACVRRDTAGCLSFHWLAAPDAPGAVLDAILTEAIDRSRQGSPISGAVPYRLRRHRTGEGDHIFFEVRRRDELGATLIEGTYFASAEPSAPAPLSALNVGAERALDWLFVEHLAQLIGPARSHEVDSETNRAIVAVGATAQAH